MSMLPKSTQGRLRIISIAMAQDMREGGFSYTAEQFGADLSSYLYEYLLDACELGYRESFEEE